MAAVSGTGAERSPFEGRRGSRAWVGFGAAAAWVLLCLAWFDVAAPWRSEWLRALAPAIAVGTVVLLALWLRPDRPRSLGRTAGDSPNRLPREVLSAGGATLLAGAMAFVFRLPLAWHGSLGYLTADGALSGLVAVRLREGLARYVFVPSVPYSGSLKSHLAALLSLAVDHPRAFALASVLFYVAFVVAACRLAEMVARQEGRPEAPTVLGAGLFLAFAPAFVTRYSLSNDGNYVEVLALGTWALLLAARWLSGEAGTRSTAVAGVLLGLACWSHVLAVIHAAAVGLGLAAIGRRRGLLALPRVAAGFFAGYVPGLLWNVANAWASLRYVVPGGQPVGTLDRGPGLPERAAGMLLDQVPVLFGYDPGNPGFLDPILLGASWVAVAIAATAVVSSLRAARRPDAVAHRLLLALAATNVVVALLALPYIPGNPRYLLFLMAPVAVLLSRGLARRRRVVLALLVAFGALGSLAQAPAAFRSDAQWRGFVEDLRRFGVRHCYTDFFLASKVNFASAGRIVCASGLGPTTTEYFPDHPERVREAPEAALVAVNRTAADKLERRLSRLGVDYERRDLMKPLLSGLSRKVEPEELFPGLR